NYNTDFNCNSGLVNTNISGAGISAYHCIGAFAKKIFDPRTNPSGVSIRTAFVGFGSVMNDLSQTYVRNSCQLSSRAYPNPLDKSWPKDKCSPDEQPYPVVRPTEKVTQPNFRGYDFNGGYGNGGFFLASQASEVTDSVIAFIDDLNAGIVDPLTTGPISVPVDPLNPRGFQPYGYLRALAPEPRSSTIIWRGNLKKYNALLTGDNAGAFAAKNSSTLVYNTDGAFNPDTKDLWNNTDRSDGGIIDAGGVYSQLPMPTTYSIELRKLFTDVSSATATAVTPQTAATDLLRIPEGPVPTATGANSDQALSAYVLQKFNSSTGQAILKDFPVGLKLKLLNYLGYNLNIDNAELPITLTAPNTKYVAMGGSIHSFPTQITYSGAYNANGKLTATRKQSLLYGTMEGGLHVVDAFTGVEQMVFVPSEILNDPTASRALVSGQSSVIPVAGVDGTWISDPAYKYNVANDGSSTVQARQMNIYGGLRMGGNSYYGLDILDPTSPKLLFRVNSSTPGYERMGQSWSKPVLANIRYKGDVIRVMIIGGGYDTCYEDPRFVLASSGDGSTCAKTTAAKGNSVYIVNANTGELIWSASNTNNSLGVSAVNADLKHSIVSRISTLDRNADGLIDHLYFADLGGQVFRADFDNESQYSVRTPNALGVRVVRLANLATKSDGSAITNGDNPRFYEPVVVTIHDQGANTFILVSLASGDRSTPLDVFPVDIRTGMSPATALTSRPVNNVYGIIDRDFIKGNLINGSPTLLTQNKTLLNLKKDPQTISTGPLVVSEFFPSTGTGKDGWYRSLSSTVTDTGSVIERANGSFRKPGGLKAFEEPFAVTGNLLIPVYDPEGTGIKPKSPCKTRVIGETDRQRYCLPYGVCLTSGAKDITQEKETGFQTQTANCPPGISECNDNIVGEGIRGLNFAPIADAPPGEEGTDCGSITLSGNQKGSGKWSCTSKLLPTRWYE
ncbi:MAG: pilus assembly protein PilY, partial [Pedobacter sp.]